MSIFTLPAAPTPDAPDVVTRLSSGDTEHRFELRLQYVSDDGAPIIADLCEVWGTEVGDTARGDGPTVAEAILSLLCSEDSRDLRLPADVAAALDELAHQAVRIVCNRLSGGTMDEATFAEPHLLDTQSGPVGLYDFADEKPACPMCGHGVSHQIIRGPEKCDNCGWYRLELTNTAPEGNHPRSMENVLR